VAATDAQFGLPEVTRGIVAAAGGLFRLPRVLPPARAMELILTAERLGAEEAARWGLVNHLVEAEDVVGTARALADRICRNAPLAVRESLAIARDALRIDDDEAWERSAAAMTRVRDSADAKEGVQAFVDKRPAQWTGR
jgi:enoyl-CoA hydratase/carnithine racemase